MGDNSADSNLSEYTPMTLTPLPASETLISAATLVIEDTEKYLNGGLINGDPVKGIDIGYGCQLNATNMPYIVAAMLNLPSSSRRPPAFSSGTI